MARRILIIEDNPVNRDLLEYLLQSFGFDTLSEEDGVAGLATAQRERPDLILCDVHMSGMDGLEVARHLKADPATAGMALIAVTALAMVGDRDRILAAGFDGYIAKPIEPEELLAQLQRYLPPAAPAPSASSPAPGAGGEAPATARRPTVLVLDDTPINLEYKRSLLEPAGCRVLSSTDPTAALRLALEHRPELVITDFELGTSTGLDFMRVLREQPLLGSTPVLFVSASRWDTNSKEAALQMGAIGYLTRPIEPQRLLEAVHAALHRSGP